MPLVTSIQVVAPVLVACAMCALWPLLLLVVLALFSAVALEGFVGWLSLHGMQPKLSFFLWVLSVMTSRALSLAFRCSSRRLTL